MATVPSSIDAYSSSGTSNGEMMSTLPNPSDRFTTWTIAFRRRFTMSRKFHETSAST